MQSCLYRGWIRHQRLGAVRHKFQYPVFMVYLDLDELAELDAKISGFSASGRAPIQLRRRDHAGAPELDWRSFASELLTAAGLPAPSGPIRLLTNLRWLGHCFNPISVYYCFSADGAGLEACILEVTNTPWGERHCYVLDMAGSAYAQRFGKCLHVSPLMPMGVEYRAWLVPPADVLSFAINNHEQGALEHRASVVMQKQLLTTSSLWRNTIKQGSMTMKNVWRIHWQAARLYFKGAKPHRHPAR